MKPEKTIFILGSLAIFLSLIPFFLNYLLPVVPGRVNPHWDNWPYDFNYYRSIIVQGKSGRLTTLDKYTSENQSGKFLRIGYIIIGHLARIFNLDETIVYHIARVVLGTIFVYLTYLFIKTNFYENKFKKIIVLAFLLSLFCAGYPTIDCHQKCRLIPRLWSMTQLDPIRRITFLPHFLLGQIAFITTLLAISFEEKNNLLKAVLMGIFLGLAGLDHPSSLLLFYPVIGLFFIVGLKKKILETSLMKKIIIIFLATLPFVFYLFWATSIFPWNLSRQAVYPLDGGLINFALAAGPAFIIGLLMSIYILLSPRRKEVVLNLTASWLLTTVLLTFIKFPGESFSQARFLQVGFHIPGAILTAYFVFLVFRNKEKNVLKIKTLVLKFIMILIFLAVLPTLIYLYYDQLDYTIYFAKTSLSYIPYPPVIDYPPLDWMKGIFWLKDNTKSDEIVLSDFTAGNFIPAYAGNTVFYGHEIETYNSAVKKQAVINFFSSNDPINQKNFLIKNRIKYIFFGPQERAYRQKELIIDNLKPVYTNPLVTIYKVMD
ncbi:MAG: hypothetical protein QHH09_03050 [Microgenomates group bacterium]|nr:hypothetical protein [Microgenomates group bacterium]